MKKPETDEKTPAEDDPPAGTGEADGHPEHDDDDAHDDDGANDDDSDADNDDAHDDDSDADDDADDDEDDDAPPPRSARDTRSLERLAPRTLMFVGAVALLDATVNVRYPLDEPPFWYLIPSADIAVILLNFAIMGFLRTPVPRWMRVLVVVWLFVVRCLRFGDGIKGRYFAQRFNLYSDLRLIPDGIAFIHSTRSWLEIIVGGLVALGLLAGLAVLCYRLVGYVAGYLEDRRQTLLACGLIGVSYVLTSATSHSPRIDTFFSGGFAASAMPRLQENVAFFWNVRGQATEYAQLIAQTESMLGGIPSDLKKLKGANVQLILVESYGRALFEWPPLMEISRDTFAAFEKNLGAQGYSIATSVLDSPTYGGQSWLAHATLDTGIPTRDQLEYEILSAKKPKPIASYFRQAGYRTVAVQPNTTRAWTEGNFFDFQQKYYNKELEYRGPAYAWATMPDQYVLDFVRRRELERESRNQPLFVQYVLVSSHAPWAAIPGIVDDWSTIGDGSLFHRVPTQRFPIEWPHFENATEAYGKSIVYDFKVLETFLTRFVKDGSLVIILGDHQPVFEVNGDSWEYGVPIHVLSRNPELVRPFVTRGYRPGIVPELGGYHQSLATFLPSLLVNFSGDEPTAPSLSH